MSIIHGQFTFVVMTIHTQKLMFKCVQIDELTSSLDAPCVTVYMGDRNSNHHVDHFWSLLSGSIVVVDVC